MKNSTLLFLIALTPFFTHAQFDRALKAGNANEAGRYLGNAVELTINAEEQTLSSLEVVNELQAFFSECEVQDFKVVHKGESSSGLQYTIGDLVCEETTFSVTYYYKSGNGLQQIGQLIFEEQ